MNEDTDVRELLLSMSAEVGPLQANPDLVARKASFRLLRTAMIGVLVLTLVAVGGVAGAHAFQASDTERPAARVPSPSPSSAVVIVSQSSLDAFSVGQRFDLDGGHIYAAEGRHSRSDVQLAQHGAELVLIFRLSRPVRLPGDTAFTAVSPSALRGFVYKPVGTRLPVTAGEVLAVRTNEGNYSKLQVVQCCGSHSRPYIEFRFVTYG